MNPKLVRLGTLVLSTLLTTTTTAAPDEKSTETVKQAAEALKGQWLMTKATVNGAPNGRMAGRARYFFDGTSSYIISNDYVVTVEGDFLIDPKRSPRTIDLVSGAVGAQNRTYGIYEIDGDTLKLCLTMNVNRRPSQFESKRGSGDSLYIFKRVKD
jgi:uncharacterized protein (TIGR03067 family)